MKSSTDSIHLTSLGKNFLPEMNLSKKLGYYEIEHIDDPCEVTIAINPKVYLEKFQSENVNKKHKGLRKGSRGMEFENYATRINSVTDIETLEQLSQEKQGQLGFQ